MDTGCTLEDFSGAMNDRDGWCEIQVTPCRQHDLMVKIMMKESLNCLHVLLYLHMHRIGYEQKCLIRFVIFVEWHINLRGLFNAKAFLVEEQLYCLTNSRGDKGVHIFPKRNSPKVSVIVRLGFELAVGSYKCTSRREPLIGRSFWWICLSRFPCTRCVVRWGKADSDFSWFWIGRKTANFTGAISWSTTSIRQERLLTVVNNIYSLYND